MEPAINGHIFTGLAQAPSSSSSSSSSQAQTKSLLVHLEASAIASRGPQPQSREATLTRNNNISSSRELPRTIAIRRKSTFFSWLCSSLMISVRPSPMEINNIRQADQQDESFEGSKRRPVSCLLNRLLSATLLASILNTLLLGFLVKSIRLDDRGLINGQLKWDLASESSSFLSPTRLAKDKSISLKSIETFQTNDKPSSSLFPLKLEIWPGGRETTGSKKALNIIKSERTHPTEPVLFLSTSINNKLGEDGFESDTMNEGGSNYMAAADTTTYIQSTSPAEFTNNQNIEPAKQLEIGTKLLALNVIDPHEHRLVVSTNGNKKSLRRKVSPGNRNDNKNLDGGRKLFEFNEDRQSVTLPLETKFRVSPPTSGSVSVLEELKAAEITGSLASNLEVQTRDGNLRFSSSPFRSSSGNSLSMAAKETSRESQQQLLRLVSRSGSVQLVSSGWINVNSESFSLSSKELYIPEGVEYLDDEVSISSSSEQDNTNAAIASEETIAQEENTNEQPVASTSSSGLKAYNLVMLDNGLLIAAADQ